jgi:hypothetical protein
MTTKENIFDLYAQAYESQKQHRLSLKEYLEGCRADPAMYASTANVISAIEPEFADGKDAARAHLHEPDPQDLPGLQDFYGLEETIDGSSASSGTPRGLEEKEADSLPPGSRRRRQILAGERLGTMMPLLRSGYQRWCQPHLREPARPV